MRPVYFVLLRGWMLLGEGDAWLRTLSVLFGVGAVYLTWRLGCTVGGRSTGFVAACMLAVSPLAIYHSQEVRMYMVGTFLGLAGTLAVNAALDDPLPRRIRWWAGLRLVTVLTAPLNALLLLGDLLLVWRQFRGQPSILTRFARPLAALVALWLPFAILGATKFTKFTNDWIQIVARPDAAALFNTSLDFTAHWQKLYWRTVPDFPSDAVLWSYGIYAGLIWVMAGLGFLSEPQRMSRVAVWGLLPVAALFAISYLTSSFWIGRYLVFASPYFLILVGAGVTRVWHRHRALAAVIAGVYLLGAGAALHRLYAVQDREDWRGVLGAISADEAAGEE